MDLIEYVWHQLFYFLGLQRKEGLSISLNSVFYLYYQIPIQFAPAEANSRELSVAMAGRVCD